MSLKRLHIANEPQDTRARGGSFGVNPVIVGRGRLGVNSGAETVQPGTKYVPFPILPELDRRDIVSIPLGPPNFIRSVKEPPFKIIPQLVGTTDPRSTSTRAPVARGSPVPQKTPKLPTKEQKVGSLDLGNILNTGLDLYAKYKGIKTPVAVAAPARVAAAQESAPVTSWPKGYGVDRMAGPQFISNEPGGGIPFGDFIAEPPAEAIADGLKGWAYKKSCGEWKWIKSRNRRRRKLLTDSDYNGLLKLQTLKVNSNMNIAIAKSIGR